MLPLDLDMVYEFLMPSSPRFRTQVGVCVHPKQAKAQIAYSLCQIHQLIPAHLNWQTEEKKKSLVSDQNFMKRNV